MNASPELEALFERLERRLVESREYPIVPKGYFAGLERSYAHFQREDPDPTRREAKWSPRKKTITYLDWCIRGPGTQRQLAEAMGLDLPADYILFCDRYREYLIAGRRPVHITAAEEIEQTIVGLREGWDVPLSTPHRLFHFAQIVEETGNFAFRWSEDGKTMDVVVAEDFGVVGEPILLGPNGDRYITDRTFTDWLTRMLDSDCFPLTPTLGEESYDDERMFLYSAIRRAKKR